MKNLGISFLLFLGGYAGFTQPVQQTLPATTIQIHPRGFISTFPGPPPGVRGTTYLYDSWKVGSILLTDDKTIQHIPVKLDVQNRLVEIDYNGQTKLLDYGRVKALDMMHPDGTIEHFVNGKSLSFAAAPIDGLFSFVKEGRYNLLQLTRAVKTKPFYNTALDVGSKDYEIVKEKSYFIMKDNTVVPVDKSKKKFSGALKEAFGEDFDKKLDKVKVGKGPSLIAFVASLNSAS